MTETSPIAGPTTHLDLEDLRSTVAGPVLAPGDVAVVTELAGFNLAPQHEPVAVVGATCTDDVAAAVRWAAARGVGVAVLATGHGDWSHRDRLVISTRRLDDVEVDREERRARVGAGVKWARVVEALAPTGLGALCGSSTDVGVVGYTLGGGVGPLARHHGLASDHVRRLRVVAGDGTVEDVTATSAPDLFWAMLGGKDVAGIVTEIEFDLVAVPRLHGGGIFYAADDVAAVLHAWREWAPTLPESTTTSVAILRMPDLDVAPPPLRGRTLAHLRVAHLGSAESGAELLAPMRAVATPLVDTVADLPFAAIDAVHSDPVDPMPSWVTGGYLDSIDAGTVEALLAAVGPQHELPLVLVELRHLEGAATRGTVGCAARAPFAVGVVAPMVPELAEVVPAIGLGILDALSPWSSGSGPVNWASPQTLGARPGWGWDEADRERLAAVARRQDPAGVLAAGRYGLG